MNRRHLITGLVSLVAAPAIVRSEALMQIRGDIYRIWQKQLPLLPPLTCVDQSVLDRLFLGPNGRLFRGTWTFFGKTGNIYSDKIISFTKEEYAA